MSDSSDSIISRRKFLIGVGGGIGGLTVLSGCINSLPGTGGGGTSNGGTSSEASKYRQWILKPDSESDSKPQTFSYVRPSDLSKHSKELKGSLGKIAKGGEDFKKKFNINKVNEIISTPSGPVIIGGKFKKKKVVETYKSRKGFEKQEEYKGYTLFSGSRGRMIGIGEEYLVSSGSALNEEGLGSAGSIVKKAINAKKGDSKRLHESDDSFKILTEKLGSSDYILGINNIRDSKSLTKSQPGGVVSLGYSVDVKKGTSDVRMVHVFKEASKAKKNNIRKSIKKGLVSKYESLDVSVDGRATVAKMKMKNSNLNQATTISKSEGDSSSGADREKPPMVSFAIEQTGSNDSVKTVTVIHEAGDTVYRQNINVFVNQKGVKAYTPSGDVAWSGSGKIQSGDKVKISKKDTGQGKKGLEQGDEILVIWENGQKQRILVTYTVS